MVFSYQISFAILQIKLGVQMKKILIFSGVAAILSFVVYEVVKVIKESEVPYFQQSFTEEEVSGV